jgi:hypothetical protein
VIGQLISLRIRVGNRLQVTELLSRDKNANVRYQVHGHIQNVYKIFITKKRRQA